MSNGRKPDFNVLTSPEQNSKAKPRQIGVGWLHDNGDGFSIVLEATPVDGRLVCFPIREQDESTRE